ncbi:MAG: hypothetical protein NC318_02020 [Blautia sp.]|nr:hypothetical protein [Lachnoclostridium sp.]MCM1210356.1 hypothetical protein [Blautia sp.]
MKRDFEQEFKRWKQSETPDLWGRIEAGLSEKQVAAPVFKGGKSSAYADGTAVQYKTIRKTAWHKWGTLAAACLVAVIVFPAVSFMMKRSGNKSGESNMMTDYSAGEADTAAFEDGTAADAGVGEAGAADDMIANEKAEGIASDSMTADETAEGIASGGMMNGSVAESFDVSSASDAVAADEPKESAGMADFDDSVDDSVEDIYRKEAAESESKGTVLEDLLVRIEESGLSGEKMIYTATVLQGDESAILTNGEMIEIICNYDTKYLFTQKTGTDTLLEEGKCYTVSLYQDGEEWIVLRIDVG